MKILLATDGSPSAQPAEALAAAIPWPEGTKIEVLCVDQLTENEIDLPRERFAAAHAAARAEIEARLAALIERLVAPGRVVRARIVFGRPASAIVAEADELDSDLVIVGSHDRGPLASFALGSVAAEVVDHAPCPVLIARRPSLGRVVLGQDGSAGARQAEDLLVKWPFLLRGPVQVVSASPLVPPWYMTVDAGMSPGIDGDLIQEVIDERRAASRRAAAESVTRLLAAGVEAKAVVRDGQPVDALLDAIAETGARLVVVGSRGNTGISRLLLGSVARSLLYRTTCSVLITREKKAAEPKPAPDLAGGARVSRTALVVSANAEVRGDWARYFEGLGMRALRCVGPQVLCALLDDSARCPLHDEADLAVYHREAVTPELALRLLRVGRSVPIAFADDRIGPEGRHEPSITTLAADAAGGCVGPPVAGVGR